MEALLRRVGQKGRGPAEKRIRLALIGCQRKARVWQGLPELTATTSAELRGSQGIPARYQGRKKQKGLLHHSRTKSRRLTRAYFWAVEATAQDDLYKRGKEAGRLSVQVTIT